MGQQHPHPCSPRLRFQTNSFPRPPGGRDGMKTFNEEPSPKCESVVVDLVAEGPKEENIESYSHLGHGNARVHETLLCTTEKVDAISADISAVHKRQNDPNYETPQDDSSEDSCREPDNVNFNQENDRSNDCEKNQTNGQHYLCEVCGAKLKYKKSISGHISKHGVERVFLCDLCGQSFGYRTSLEVHKRTHSSDRPFSCRICQRTFKSNNNLIGHMFIHADEGTFACSQCGKKFRVKSSMRRHMKSHTDEKSHSCQLCQRSFSQKCNLKVHMKTHTGEKMFECPQCHKQFRTKRVMECHIRTHEQEKSYTCKVCGKKFSERTALGLHKRIECENMVDICCSLPPDCIRSEDNLVEQSETWQGQCSVADNGIAATTADTVQQPKGGSRSPKHEDVIENLVEVESIEEKEHFNSNRHNKESLDALGMPPCSSRTQSEPAHTADPYPVLRAALESRQTNRCTLKIDFKYLLDRIEEE